MNQASRKSELVPVLPAAGRPIFAAVPVPNWMTPAIIEFAKDEKTKQILNLSLAPLKMDRPLFAPSGVPAERVAALRKAFHEAMNDPGFIAEAARIDIELGEISGERLHTLVEEAYAMSDDVVRAANDAMNLSGAKTE